MEGELVGVVDDPLPVEMVDEESGEAAAVFEFPDHLDDHDADGNDGTEDKADPGAERAAALPVETADNRGARASDDGAS